MIYLHTSHSLQKLVQTFLSKAGKPDSIDPLQPIWIIVQNNEMKEWISLKWAEYFEIAGNFKFVFPSEFLWKLYRIREKELPQNLPSDLNAMHWALFDLLQKKPALIEQIPFAVKGVKSSSQLFHLSSQLADVFDQYQVYRPELITAWEGRRLIIKNSDEKWQSNIWNSLQSYWKDHNMSASIPSRATAYQQLIYWLEENDQQILDQLPQQLHVFGMSHYSKPFLSIISSLSKAKDVSVYDRDLSIKIGQEAVDSVIENWNRPALSQKHLMLDLFRQKEANCKKTKMKEDKAVLPDLSVNSCHSNRREVEVLKDNILQYLDENPEAGPEDILIMVPDAEAYATILRSVFIAEENEEETALPISKLFIQRQAENRNT